MPIGSLPVDTLLPAKNNLRVVTRLLSNAELLALNATPISLVPAEPGRLLVPLAWVIRSTKPGAAAWATAPLLSMIHEGNTTGIMAASIASLLNTAAAVDTLLMADDINTSSLSLITFDRIGKAIQVRSTVVPNQGAGSAATITITVAAFSAST